MSSCFIILDAYNLFLILPDITLNILSHNIHVYGFHPIITFHHKRLSQFISYLRLYILWPFILQLHFLQISKILTLYLSCALLYTVLSTSFQFFSIPHFTRHYILSFVEISKFFFMYPGFSISFHVQFFFQRLLWGLYYLDSTILIYCSILSIHSRTFYLESIRLSRCRRAIDLLPINDFTVGTHIVIGAIAA